MPFAKVGDLNIHYKEQGEGEPIVFVHGNWTTLLEWQPVLERLPQGYRAITYDLRGRGKTNGPDNDYTMPELAADLRGLVDYLGLDRFHLVAHSLGSAVAMQFALDNPGRLKSLVILAPAFVDGMPEVPGQDERQRAFKADKGLYTQALRFMMPAIKDEGLYRRLVDEGHEQSLEATLRNIPALENWKPGDRLKDLGVPVIVITGEQDALTGGPNAERAAEALGTRNIVLPNVGHSPNIEGPDEFMRLMMDCIESARP